MKVAFIGGPLHGESREVSQGVPEIVFPLPGDIAKPYDSPRLEQKMIRAHYRSILPQDQVAVDQHAMSAFLESDVVYIFDGFTEA